MGGGMLNDRCSELRVLLDNHADIMRQANQQERTTHCCVYSKLE